MANTIWVLNGLFTLVMLAQFFSFVTMQKGAKLHWALGWFNNLYWLFIGMYYGWYGNIIITLYFVVLNYIGLRNWGNKPFKSSKIVIVTLLLLGIGNIGTNHYIGFTNIAALINAYNTTLYAVTYTLRCLGPKYKRTAVALYLVNQIGYMPTILLANPVLWGCVVRQCFMLVVNIWFLANPNNRLQLWVNNSKAKVNKLNIKWLAW